jgi:hypothetical protein
LVSVLGVNRKRQKPEMEMEMEQMNGTGGSKDRGLLERGGFMGQAH